ESLGDFVDVDLNSRGLENTKLPVPKKSIYSLGLEKKNSWFVGLQYESKLSSSFENVFLNIKNVDYRDSNSLAIGGYIIPDSSSLISYWKRIKYRFGIKNEKKSIIVNNLPINQLNEETFDDKRLVQLFNRFATYNGSNPYVTSGIMSMIQHLEHDLGVFMPTNGLSDISKSIYNLANDLGVTFSFNSNIDKIITDKNKAIGVEKNKQKYLADIIVSNMDVNLTYGKLLNGFKKPRYLKNYEPSSSAIVFYWNINRSFKELDLHNIIFSKNNYKEFDYIFNKKLMYEDPTIYICPTSKVVKDDAPEGCENWFILINSPYDSGQDWNNIKNTLRQNIIKKINHTLNISIDKHIVMEEVFTPKDIEIKTLSQYGSLYGSSSNSIMSAFLRHPNFSKKIKNLYFCGGSVHPGGGIPLCLNSAKIVSELIK
ncbi:FAD-dependent oxidoreductase, partial [Flavobacteriaceae bacterium]|nr:FAD-dependent oxidoreductase [Flavobacteriaceae bacterium]